MYLEQFSSALEERWKGSLFRVRDAKEVDARAKEYLYRLARLGKVKKVYWGWYYIPEKQTEVWDFLAGDKGFKVLIKQTAASIWNYDFVHRDVYRLAVEDQSYKKALESFAQEVGWTFEVEFYDKIPYESKMVDDLFVESPESCITSCISDWAFTDAFATLYFRRDEVDFKKLKELSRWKRISKVDTRVWTAIKYGCKLFNEQLGKHIFKVKATALREELKELIEEAVEKVVEFA
jgi:hypothetical protein